MTLSELEALAKVSERQGYCYAHEVPIETILQMIALIRQMGGVLEDLSEWHDPVMQDFISPTLDALKEFDK